MIELKFKVSSTKICNTPEVCTYLNNVNYSIKTCKLFNEILEVIGEDDNGPVCLKCPNCSMYSDLTYMNKETIETPKQSSVIDTEENNFTFNFERAMNCSKCGYIDPFALWHCPKCGEYKEESDKK